MNPDTNPPTAPATPPATPPRARNRLPWILGALALAAIPVASWIRHPRATGAAAAPRPRVAVARVEAGDLDRVVEVPAEFRPYQEVDIHSKVAGFLESISVDIGDRVEAGQLLAVIEVPELKADLDRARAAEQRAADEARRAEAAYRDAHAIWTRLDGVARSQPRLVAQQELDTVLARDQQAESSLAAARQQVAVAKAETAKLAAMSQYARIAAPFQGVITRRAADPGALIPAGTAASAQSQPIVRLSRIDRLRLAFPVSMSQVPEVHVGSHVDIRVQGRPTAIAGTVARVSRKIETATRTMDVEVDVENLDLSLVPGMYATAALRLEHRAATLAVPVQAVSHDKPPTVLLVGANQVVEQRPVRIGLETPTRVEVLEGLRAGDLVVVGSRSATRPGESVEPRVVAIP